jgi:heme-degrading monooxygenase HmoA/ketosteroid isomerase-like protein
MLDDPRVIVFRSRLRDGVADAYGARADEIYGLATAMPGLVSSTDFVADDGERLALIEFDSAANLAAWRDHTEHRRAQAEGRDRWYARYSLQICAVVRESRFEAATGAWRRSGTDPADVRAIAERWLDCFARHDLDGLLALYAEDCTHTSPKIRVRHPDTGGVLRGKPALRAWWADAFGRLPGLGYELSSITADSRRAVMEYLRHAPGEPDLPVAEVLDVANGRIVASRVFHG